MRSATSRGGRGRGSMSRLGARRHARLGGEVEDADAEGCRARGAGRDAATARSRSRARPAAVRGRRRGGKVVGAGDRRRGEGEAETVRRCLGAEEEGCHRTDQIIRVQVQKRSPSNQVSKLEPI